MDSPDVVQKEHARLCYVARRNQVQTRECRVEVVYSEGESKARESD